MKAYAQFLTTDLSGYLDEALGSEGVFVLDGRKKLETWKIDAMVGMYQLRNVHPDYFGYRIYVGSRFGEGKMVCEWIRSGAQYKRKKED